MTLAATPDAVAKMQILAATFKPVPPAPDNVSPSCTFACHGSTTNVDYYQLAIQNKVQLRITVLQTAVAGVIAMPGESHMTFLAILGLRRGLDVASKVGIHRRLRVMEEFIECFSAVADPRQDNVRHDLHEVLIIALCTMLCGGEDCSDMAEFGRAKEPFLRGFPCLRHGIPSHDMVRDEAAGAGAGEWRARF